VVSFHPKWPRVTRLLGEPPLGKRGNRNHDSATLVVVVVVMMMPVAPMVAIVVPVTPAVTIFIPIVPAVVPIPPIIAVTVPVVPSMMPVAPVIAVIVGLCLGQPAQGGREQNQGESPGSHCHAKLDGRSFRGSQAWEKPGC
jgi:hypothetical protein